MGRGHEGYIYPLFLSARRGMYKLYENSPKIGEQVRQFFDSHRKDPQVHGTLALELCSNGSAGEGDFVNTKTKEYKIVASS